MATYVIGDIQGCAKELQKLLNVIQFSSDDSLWLVGDLVNRGPSSLEALRFISRLPNTQVVLGNHDIHLLAVAAGVRPSKDLDTLQPILEAPDKEELLNWLRHQPLMIYNQALHAVLVHAGIPPCWDLATALKQASKVEKKLQSSNYVEFLKLAFGNMPTCWQDNLPEIDQQRFTINALTRMRYCQSENCLDFTYDGPIGTQPPELVPWFEQPSNFDSNLKIFFGHWAALHGQTHTPNRYALDTGCVWGNQLTALRLEDHAYFCVESSMPKVFTE